MAALPILLKENATTLAATVFLVIATVHWCWPSDRAEGVCLLICLNVKESWVEFLTCESSVQKASCWALMDAEFAGSWAEFWLTVLVCTHQLQEMGYCQSAISGELSSHLSFSI
jgi:hypothetical protein